MLAMIRYNTKSCMHNSVVKNPHIIQLTRFRHFLLTVQKWLLKLTPHIMCQGENPVFIMKQKFTQ